MPHVSKHPLKPATKQTLEKRFISLLAKAGGNRAHVLRELITSTEQIMLAKRLSMIYLISQNTPTHRISNILRMSPSTVARFEVHHEAGAFIETVIWLQKQKSGSKLVTWILDLATLPIEAQHKSLTRLMYERESR